MLDKVFLLWWESTFTRRFGVRFVTGTSGTGLRFGMGVKGLVSNGRLLLMSII